MLGFGPFAITALVGVGGMGEVYRARDTELDRDVALKLCAALLPLNPERLRRFRLEAQAAAALNHPNVLSVFHIGEHDGSPYMVTELSKGEGS